MLRSMFSAVSGLRSHQTMMDVTGNNISNVNTTGFKSSRTTFQETLSQMTRAGTAGTVNQGGENPMQVGLGAGVAATGTVFGQGASQDTGRTTDLAIQGDGFFRVQVDGEPGERYMRAGAFDFDNVGNLVGPGGEMVVDGNTGQPINVDLEQYTDISIDKFGVIQGRDGDQIVDVAQIGMARFPNVGGLERLGNGLYAATAASGGVIENTPGQNGIGTVQSGTLEMSNVDLAQEFTNLILSQRGFQANSRTITTSDELLQELVNLKR